MTIRRLKLNEHCDVKEAGAWVLHYQLGHSDIVLSSLLNQIRWGLVASK